MTSLIDHLQTGTSTVCRAWILRRKDGLVLGFTDHDVPLFVDGVACEAASGLAAGALQASTGLSVDNAEAVGALNHDAITEDDLRAGRWDTAEISIWLVNWSDPAQAEIQFKGSLGEITRQGEGFSVELRGLSEALNAVRGRVYQPRCDAILGDTRCGVDLTSDVYVAERTLSSVEDDRILRFTDMGDYEARWFERGLMTVLDGPSAGLSERIKSDRVEDGVRHIEIWAGLQSPLRSGDRVQVSAGCDKRQETCRYKFANLLNFRGFPHVPGEDWLLSYPTSRGHNDGGKL
ncbi:MAG: DUF2163 domain-containing protein [Pseudomonadota bacterium]